MIIYIDTEFNGFGGDLISIGARSDDDHEFYAVLNPPRDIVIDRWVAKNVLPVLRSVAPYKAGRGEDWDIVQRAFIKYLHAACERSDDYVTIAADWYEDLAWAARLLVFPGGKYRHLVKAFEFIDTANIDLKPDVRHNALSDARALAKWHKENQS